jgi:hypothetical protein
VSFRPRWPVIAGAALAALLVAFLGGRYSRAPQVVTKDVVRTQTVEVEKVRTVEVHDSQSAVAQEAKVNTVTVVKYRWLPGHVVEAESTTTKQADTDTHETKQAHAGATKESASMTQQTVIETHTSTSARPRWSVSLMPGAQLFGAKALPLYGPLVLGASVERRIAGPVSIGLWGSTSGAAGITLRGDIP